MPRARRRSSHDPRACRLLRRPRIKHALLFEGARKFRILVTSMRLDAFPELARLIEHEDRGTRSDLLEGICLVMEATLSRTDIASGRVGWKRRYRARSGRLFDFVGLPRQTVANWTTLSEETVSRAYTTLRRAGLVHGPGLSAKRGGDCINVIAQPYEECDVTPKTPRGRRALPCIRRVHESFWIALDLHRWRAQVLKPRKAPPKAPRPELAAALASRNMAATGALVSSLANALALEEPPDSG
jgi:DNA-binding transcriptional ArsR family regulator